MAGLAAGSSCGVLLSGQVSSPTSPSSSNTHTHTHKRTRIHDDTCISLTCRQTTSGACAVSSSMIARRRAAHSRWLVGTSPYRYQRYCRACSAFSAGRGRASTWLLLLLLLRPFAFVPATTTHEGAVQWSAHIYPPKCYKWQC